MLAWTPFQRLGARKVNLAGAKSEGPFGQAFAQALCQHDTHGRPREKNNPGAQGVGFVRTIGRT